MSVSNRDSSLLTQKKAAKVLYSHYLTNKADLNNGTTVRHEQTSPILQNIVTQRHTGAAPYKKELLLLAKDPNYNNFDHYDNNQVLGNHVQ
jgi:hypothetical protein